MYKWVILGIVLMLGATAWVVSDRLGQHGAGTLGVEVNWRELGELDYITGKAPEALKKLNGERVKIPGFMVPLEDETRRVKEFLLVPSPQACIHVPPPPPNQMIYVRMKDGSETETAYGPIWIHGTLNLTTQKSMYGEASFELIGDVVEPYK